MAQKERFGKFVLLDEIDSSGLGSEYRAAKLGPAGLEKIVSLVRLSPAVSTNPEVAKNLMEQAKVAAQLQNPNILKIYGIGKVESAYYMSFEFIEGKSLRAIINRCRTEGFPFSIDHTLLIASKVCSALEFAHNRKSDGGRYFHGLVTPASVLVSYEGEVRVRGFGQWPSRVKEAGFLRDDESGYLAPEQAAGSMSGTRSDIFAVGAILFETLTGRSFFEGGRGTDVRARLAQARLANPTSDDDSMPKPIADILGRALAEEPAARYAEVQEMRKAIDTLLFSGDFTPTTFNLAFFMHSLFREDIERESKALKEDREASYVEYLTEEHKTPTGARTLAPMTYSPPPVLKQPEIPVARPETSPFDIKHAPAIEPPHVSHLHPAPGSGPVAIEPPPGLPAREAAAGFTFHKAEQKSRAPVLGGLALVVLLAAGAGWYFAVGPGALHAPPTTLVPPPPSLSPEAIAAMEKVKELEEKLRTLEAEKAAAEGKAAEDAKKKLEAQAAARGQAVDPQAVVKAQDEARKKAQAEQEKKVQEERRRIEEEKKAEEARVADEQRKAEETRKAEEATRVATVTSTTTLPPATAPAAAVPALKPGTLVNLSDTGVIAPVVERKPVLQYPPIAQRQRVEGTVELNVLVDEKGNVVDAQVVTGSGGKAGLNEAAIDAVKRYKYRPASKEGVPVKLWMPVRVKFELPK